VKSKLSTKVLSPSDYILKEIEIRELMISVLPSEITKVVIQEKPVTPEIAKKLESIFDINSDTWLELQKEYDNTRFRFWSIKIGNKIECVVGGCNQSNGSGYYIFGCRDK